MAGAEETLILADWTVLNGPIGCEIKAADGSAWHLGLLRLQLTTASGIWE